MWCQFNAKTTTRDKLKADGYIVLEEDADWITAVPSDVWHF